MISRTRREELGKAKSSFCEQKEAKKLCHFGSVRTLNRTHRPNITKSFFASFFQK